MIQARTSGAPPRLERLEAGGECFSAACRAGSASRPGESLSRLVWSYLGGASEGVGAELVHGQHGGRGQGVESRAAARVALAAAPAGELTVTNVRAGSGAGGGGAA